MAPQFCFQEWNCQQVNSWEVLQREQPVAGWYLVKVVVLREQPWRARNQVQLVLRMVRGRGSSLERELLERWAASWKKGKEKVQKGHWVEKLQGWAHWE